MTKTLEQIQEENRKAIIMACYPIKPNDCLKMLFASHEAKSYEKGLFSKLLTLDHVLFALGDGFKCKVVKDHSPDNNVYLWIYNYNVKILWDLTELTLEDQTEEAQRAVNELLGEK